jgi:hypothetical protein
MDKQIGKIGRVRAGILSLSLLAWPLTGDSADPVAYQVEMLAFAYSNAPQMAGSVPAQSLPSTEEAVQLDVPTGSKYFHALPASELSLATAESILDSSSSYEVIAHVAWRQPGLAEAAAKAVHIEGGPEYRAYATAAQDYGGPQLYAEPEIPVTLKQLDGTVTLVLGQYLHIYTDLVLRRPVTAQVADSAQHTRTSNALHQFRIQGHRRMRSKELHYLDHPLLGILVQVTPLEQETAHTATGTME